MLRFVREPAAPSLTSEEPGEPGTGLVSRVLGAEQSNTSLVFGDRAILKVLRRLFPGANPDLEVADALARRGSARVAAPYGWIETDLDSEPVLLGVLSKFLAGASDGWTLALDTPAAPVRAPRRLRSGVPDRAASRRQCRKRASDGRCSAELPFAAEARLLGQATAELHADMASAFGSRDMTAAELAGVAAGLHGKLIGGDRGSSRAA